MEGGIPQGTQVGSYVIDGLLGRGGMGIVYRAYHPRLDRWAAIKVLPPFNATGDAHDRFEREARAIARLRHSHILTVFDFGEFAGQPYMAVELMPNGSMDERMPAEPRTVAEALTILRPLAEALDYAHSQGVLHRDVKPANIFLDSGLQPVLADFGLAKLYSEESMTASGFVSGTPTHMSPEQANGKPITGATDQYSLAVIAYQLLAGQLPFKGALMELLYAHVNTPPPAASSFNPALPTLVDDVLARGLAKDPGDRWHSCVDFIGALEAAGAGRQDERSVVRPAPGGPVQGIEVPATMAVPLRAAGRGRLLYGGLAAAVVLALVAGAALATGALRLPGASTSPVAAAATPSPVPSSSAAATPTPRPTATPTVLRTIGVTPPSPLRRGTSITVTFRGLAAASDPVVGVLQGNKVYPINGGTPAVAGPDGTFTSLGTVPSALRTGAAILVACPGATTDLTRCIQKPVEIS